MKLGMRGEAERWLVVVFGLLILAALGPLVVEPVAEKTRIPYIPSREADRSSGVVMVLRGLQMSLADICYNKSSEYQHSGAKYRNLEEDILGDQIREDADTPHGAQATTTPVHADPGDQPGEAEHAHHAHHHDHDVLPLILKPNEDARGLIGQVEREVKPYAEKHLDHVRPEESLPWLRLATWINPEHEKAWVATAFWLQRTKQPHAVMDAIELLEQAKRLNRPPPDGVYDKQGLLYMLGHLYLVEAGRPAKALTIFEEAVRHGIEDFPQLDPVQQDWLNFTFRDLVQTCRKLKQYDNAIEYCKRGIELFPDDGVLHRMLPRLERERAQHRAQEG